MVRIVEQRGPVDAESFAADLIGLANQAAPAAIAVVALEVAFGRLTLCATNELVLRASADATNAHSRAVAAGRLLVALLARDGAGAIADHELRVERAPVWAGANAIDARRAHLRTAVTFGLARLADCPADQCGDLHARAFLAFETVTAWRVRSTREAIAHAGRGV